MSLSVQESEEASAETQRAIVLDNLSYRRRGGIFNISALTLGCLAFAAGMGAMWLLTAHRAASDSPVFAVNETFASRAEFTHRLDVTAGIPVARQMLAEYLNLQFAHKIGAEPTEAEVDAAYARQSVQPGFAANLAASRQTEADVKRVIRLSMAEFRALTRDIHITDKDTRDYYNAQSDRRSPNVRYYAPETALVAAIVTDQEADIKRAREELAQGTPFAEAARKYSKDQSKANGGGLPPIQRGRIDNNRLPGLENTVFSLAIGQQADNVKIGGAWWIIRCLNKTPERVIPFEQVREECHDAALLAQGKAVNGKRIEAEFAAFRQSAHIEAYAPGYKELVETK